MVNVMLEMLDGFFFGMSSDVPTFTAHVFTTNFELEQVNISNKHSSTNFAHLLTFIGLPILQELSIYRWWFLFGMVLM